MRRSGNLTIGPPTPGDGARMHELAIRAGGLDVNSGYAYVLWVRDFAATTSIARDGADLLAYCLGYLRPEAPDTYFVWQIAAHPAARGRGLATALLNDVVERTGARALEATVTPGNAASHRLFSAFAHEREAILTREPLFQASDFPGSHDAEDLLRIEPLLL